MATAHIGGHSDNGPDRVTFDTPTHFFDRANELMPENDGLSRTQLAVATPDDFGVRAADGGGLDADEQFIVFDDGHRNEFDLKSDALGVTGRDHGRASCCNRTSVLVRIDSLTA